MRLFILSALLSLIAVQAAAQTAEPRSHFGLLKDKLFPSEVQTGSASTGCSGTDDFTKLLSPECIDRLRALRAPVGNSPASRPPSPAELAPAAATHAAGSVQCSVSIFSYLAAGQQAQPSTAMSSFAAPSLERCIEVGVRLSYGVPSVTNITALDQARGLVAITCRREGQNAKTITCDPQPQAQGKKS